MPPMYATAANGGEHDTICRCITDSFKTVTILKLLLLTPITVAVVAGLATVMLLKLLVLWFLFTDAAELRC